MLSALAAGAVGIDANVFRLNDNFDAFVDLRRHINAGKRSVPPLGLIERRNAHQAVYTDFPLQQTESVLAIPRERRRLESGFFAGLVVVENGLKPASPGPSQVHAQQHGGPVLRLGAA